MGLLQAAAKFPTANVKSLVAYFVAAFSANRITEEPSLSECFHHCPQRKVLPGVTSHLAGKITRLSLCGASIRSDASRNRLDRRFRIRLLFNQVTDLLVNFHRFVQFCHCAPHLIILSARYSRSGGMVTPIWFAVLKLMTKSNFRGRSTGRSAGLTPFRILSTCVAARR